VRGLEAYADGFDVLPALEAAEIGELFITAIWSRDVFSLPHFERNAGQCDPGERLKTMEPAVHPLPQEIDDECARIRLNAVGMGVDALTSEQEEIRFNAATGTVTEEASWRLWGLP
jgi:S-adenosylhomocysteine hydrolase